MFVRRSSASEVSRRGRRLAIATWPMSSSQMVVTPSKKLPPTALADALT
jgi:hypothetical protein